MERLAGKIILLWGWRRTLLSLLAGAFLVLTQAPYDFPAAGFISFTILVWLLDGATPDRPTGVIRRLKPAFATGFWFGFGYFLAGLWWVGAAFLVDAESYAWALPIGVVFLPAFLALFYGLAAALSRLFWSEGLGRLFMLAAAFGLAEWLRSFAFTGFPWNAIGYGIMPIPLLMQPVDGIGMTGMNVLAVLLFSMPALLSGPRHRKTGFALLAVLIAAQAGYGYWRLHAPSQGEAKTLRVRIIQTAEDQATKWDAETRASVFRSLLQQSSAPPAEGQPKPDLIIWPETTVPYLLTSDGSAIAAIGEALADGQALLAGVVRSEETTSSTRKTIYYNSAMLIDDKGVILDAADKVHLVPGGEYIPFEEMFSAIGVDQIIAGPNNFVAGTNRRVLDFAGTKLLPLICYEVIFGDEIYPGTRGANVLVNLSNDGWFGNTPGPYQHLRQAQVRAVETGRPMLRATNAGISAAIDAKGRIVDALQLTAAGALDVSLTVPGRQPDRLIPPYQTGFAIAFGALLIAFGFWLIQRIRAN